VRRLSSLISMCMLALLGWVALSHSVIAQDATPAGGDESMPPGTTFTPLAFGQVQQLMLPDGDFVLFRITIDPGANFPADANDPSTGLVYVESGTVTINATAPLNVLRASTMAMMVGSIASATPTTEEAPPFEQIAANTDFQLAAGDSVLVPGNVGGNLRNDGTEQVSILIANIGPSEDQQGTPVS